VSRLAASEGTSKPLPKINDRPSPTERGPRTPFERLPGLALGGEALPDSGAGLATSAYQAYLRICTRIRLLNFRDCHNAQWYRGPMSQSSESDPTYVSYTRGGGPKNRLFCEQVNGDGRFECNTGCHTRGQPLDLRPCEPARRHPTRPAVS
jgi:hypothetical protein